MRICRSVDAMIGRQERNTAGAQTVDGQRKKREKEREEGKEKRQERHENKGERERESNLSKQV